MLWLAIILPALPLQLAERAIEQRAPLAIVDGPAQRLFVVHCNEAARAAGIAPGIKLAAAQALARDLLAVARNAERERDALAELALWAYQFSAQVAVQPAGLLLEIGGSERLFGGRARLTRALDAGLAELGYRGVLAYAVTPRAAWLLALAREQRLAVRHVAEAAQLEPTLAPLPLGLLHWDTETTSTLHALGLATIGDLLRLPRDAFARRFGAACLDDLDRALGRRADPQPLYEPPARFASRIELPADLTEAAQLMYPAQRLLAALEGFLRGRNAGITELVFRAGHNPRRDRPRPPTAIPLALAAPERDAKRLAALLAERIARVQLPEPAVTLALEAGALQPFAAVNASLLPQPAAAGVDWLKLAETLHARLGSERVFQLQAVDDHRPERAWRAVPIAIDGEWNAATPPPAAPRPLLVLPAPQPLAVRGEQPWSAREPLTLVTGPERIEAGWWDLASPAAGAPARAVHRDYFVARNGRGQWLWIYRELAAPRGWFLHGVFA
jgi:protein ImuB